MLLPSHLCLDGLVADDIAQGVVRRQHNLALVSALAVALQCSSRHGTLLFAPGRETHDVDLIVRNAYIILYLLRRADLELRNVPSQVGVKIAECGKSNEGL